MMAHQHSHTSAICSLHYSRYKTLICMEKEKETPIGSNLENNIWLTKLKAPSEWIRFLKRCYRPKLVRKHSVHQMTIPCHSVRLEPKWPKLDQLCIQRLLRLPSPNVVTYKCPNKCIYYFTGYWRKIPL